MTERIKVDQLAHFVYDLLGAVGLDSVNYRCVCPRHATRRHRIICRLPISTRQAAEAESRSQVAGFKLISTNSKVRCQFASLMNGLSFDGQPDQYLLLRGLRWKNCANGISGSSFIQISIAWWKSGRNFGSSAETVPIWSTRAS